MFIGNSKGLVVPGMTTDSELEHLRLELPDEVQVTRVDENLSTLSNHCACNDHIAIVNPEISNETVLAIENTLQVQVFQTKINGEHSLVGSYLRLTNRGGLVHPQSSLKCLEQLSQICKLPLCAGTVNRGSAVVGAGLICNDSAAFCGTETTSNEVSVIDAIY
jgi:translation initiation factor 6